MFWKKKHDTLRVKSAICIAIYSYLRYGPNIWTNFKSLQSPSPPAKCEPDMASTISSGKSDENATIMSAMNK